MTEDKDIFDDIIDWVEPKKELTDEELAFLMQDGDAMSDFKLAMDAQQVVARHHAKEEGLPFDLDQEWNKLSAFIDEEESKEENIEKREETNEEEPNKETLIEEIPLRSKRKPLYTLIGIAASLLVLFPSAILSTSTHLQTLRWKIPPWYSKEIRWLPRWQS